MVLIILFFVYSFSGCGSRWWWRWWHSDLHHHEKSHHFCCTLQWSQQPLCCRQQTSERHVLTKQLQLIQAFLRYTGYGCAPALFNLLFVSDCVKMFLIGLSSPCLTKRILYCSFTFLTQNVALCFIHKLSPVWQSSEFITVAIPLSRRGCCIFFITKCEAVEEMI